MYNLRPDTVFMVVLCAQAFAAFKNAVKFSCIHYVIIDCRIYSAHKRFSVADSKCEPHP